MLRGVDTSWNRCWDIPATEANVSGMKRTRLERYAARLNCVEVNSSFYRIHKRSTWQRWAAGTPAGFQFSIKVPKTITHIAKLLNCGKRWPTSLSRLQGSARNSDRCCCRRRQVTQLTQRWFRTFYRPFENCTPGLLRWSHFTQAGSVRRSTICSANSTLRELQPIRQRGLPGPQVQVVPRSIDTIDCTALPESIGPLTTLRRSTISPQHSAVMRHARHGSSSIIRLPALR